MHYQTALLLLVLADNALPTFSARVRPSSAGYRLLDMHNLVHMTCFHGVPMLQGGVRYHEPDNHGAYAQLCKPNVFRTAREFRAVRRTARILD